MSTGSTNSEVQSSHNLMALRGVASGSPPSSLKLIVDSILNEGLASCTGKEWESLFM
jgi:hypothetical protein